MFNKIKEDLLTARKNKDAKKLALLSLVVSEYEMAVSKNKNATVEATIKKLIQSNEESLKYRANQELVDENIILYSYLPKTLTESEIQEHLHNIEISNNFGKSMGNAMSYFKKNNLAVDTVTVKKVIESRFQDS